MAVPARNRHRAPLRICRDFRIQWYRDSCAHMQYSGSYHLGDAFVDGRIVRKTFLLALALVWQFAPFPGVASAQATDAEQELIERYTPILMLVEQQHACDPHGEPYDAGPASIALEDASFVVRKDVPGQPIIASGPTADDLAGLDETHYIDLPGDPLKPGCTYERLSQQRMQGQPPTTHVHIAREAGEDGFAIQYWFFYLFNDYNNTHEGDWEMIQVVFDVNTMEEALRTEPTEVGFAQHGGGEWSPWDHSKFEREGTRPLVFVSRGSHASQFDRAVYLSWGENNTGFGCDVTTDADVRVPLQPMLIGGGSDPTSVPVWVTYEGRWGQKETWEFSGPYGPGQSFKWEFPMTWQQSLRPSSLAVPLTGALGPTPTGVFCMVSATSSDLFRQFSENPWVALAYIAVGVALIARLLAISRETLIAAARLYLGNLTLFIPAGIAVILVALVVNGTRWLGDIAFGSSALVDTPAVWSTFTFVGQIAQQIISLVLIAPMVVFATGEIMAGRRPTIRDVVDQERQFLARMVRALLRPFVLISLLTLIPFGFLPATYLTVQRIFIPQAVVLENDAPRAAWSRSVRAVKRRWWRTAALSGTLTALIAIPSPLVGLLLLIVAARSVEFVNVASSLVYAIVAPFVFVALTVHYLSRRNEQGTSEPADQCDAVPAPSQS
jgi:hypothetical protein